MSYLLPYLPASYQSPADDMMIVAGAVLLLVLVDYIKRFL